MSHKKSFRKLKGNVQSKQRKKRTGPHLCRLGCFELKLRFRLWFGGIPAKVTEINVRANHGETEKESRTSIITPGVTFFPFKLTKESTAMSDLLSWAPC